MVDKNAAAGLAALSICEALLLTLVERGVLKVEEVRSALDDAAAAHRISSGSDQDQSTHKAAEHIIEYISRQVGAANQSGLAEE